LSTQSPNNEIKQDFYQLQERNTLEQQPEEMGTIEGSVIRCRICKRLGYKTFECPGKNRRNKSKSTKTSRPTTETAQPHHKAPKGVVQGRLNHLVEEDGNDAQMVYHITKRTMEELPMSCVNPSVFPHQMLTTKERVVNPELVEAIT
jgi:hypothetical protein